jgi:hypothetical protein
MAATMETWSNRAIGKANAFLALPFSPVMKESSNSSGIASLGFGLVFSAIFYLLPRFLAKG